MPRRFAVAFMRSTNAASLPEMASASMTVTSFADLMMTACKRLLDGQRLADLDTDLARRLQRRDQRAGYLVVEVELSLLDRLERQISGHQLRQRCGVPDVVDVLGVKDLCRSRVQTATSGSPSRAPLRAAKSTASPRCQSRDRMNKVPRIIQFGSATTFGPRAPTEPRHSAYLMVGLCCLCGARQLKRVRLNRSWCLEGGPIISNN